MRSYNNSSIAVRQAAKMRSDKNELVTTARTLEQAQVAAYNRHCKTSLLRVKRLSTLSPE